MMSSYMTRAMRHPDPRFCRILRKLGYAAAPSKAEVEKAQLAKIREEYQEVVGKRPFNGWDAATLREKMAEVQREREEPGAERDEEDE